jgi:hypothetical protein
LFAATTNSNGLVSVYNVYATGYYVTETLQTSITSGYFYGISFTGVGDDAQNLLLFGNNGGVLTDSKGTLSSTGSYAGYLPILAPGYAAYSTTLNTWAYSDQANTINSGGFAAGTVLLWNGSGDVNLGIPGSVEGSGYPRVAGI